MNNVDPLFKLKFSDVVSMSFKDPEQDRPVRFSLDFAQTEPVERFAVNDCIVCQSNQVVLACPVSPQTVANVQSSEVLAAVKQGLGEICQSCEKVPGRVFS